MTLVIGVRLRHRGIEASTKLGSVQGIFRINRPIQLEMEEETYARTRSAPTTYEGYSKIEGVAHDEAIFVSTIRIS